MQLPTDRKYTASPEWLMDMGNGSFRVGLSDFAQHALGDIVFIDLPAVGDKLTKDVSLGDSRASKPFRKWSAP